MSFTITENMVMQFSNNFRVLYQQHQARLRPWCQIEAGIVGQSKSVERMGRAEAYDITSRHPTPSSSRCRIRGAGSIWSTRAGPS